MIYGSSQTNPQYANYQGSQTYNFTPVASSPAGPINAQGQTRIGSTSGGGSMLGASTGPSAPAPRGFDATRDDINAPQWEGYRQSLSSGGQQADPYAGVRNEISGAWDSYLGGLGETSGYLDDQRTAQEGIANSQLQQGQNVANQQKASSLRDIANTTRNAFQAGNNYLGSLGAGDSSAANQYSFAINQQAGKQTGDLNNFVSGQMQNLQSEHDQQINHIASWFADSQSKLKQQIAQGGLQKGQDLASLSKGILDQAIQATNQIKANTQNQYNSLVTWAANNSHNLGQLQQNIAGIPQAMGQMSLGAGGVGGRPAYGGAVTNGKTDLFGNSIA